MEIGGVFPLKPHTLALPLHLESLEYISEVTLDLGSILAPDILLQVIYRFDTTPTRLFKSLNRWVQVQVIHYKGVRMRGSQQDQNR